MFEKEKENERKRGGGLFGADIRSRVLCRTRVSFVGTEKSGQDEPWDRMGCIELERWLEQ